MPTEVTIFYFGFDGDATGKYLELAFGDLDQDESEVLKISQTVSQAIKMIRKLVCSETRDSKSIIFAEGDNVLFNAQYSHSLLSQLQKVYRELTGLSSSIGFGKTLREATVAMRLSKAQKGDSIVGVALRES